MNSIFYRSSILAFSTCETSENKRIVQSEEITIEDFTKKY